VADFSVHDARASLSRLIDRALAGEEVVITRKGPPVVKLQPVQVTKQPRRLGALAGEFEIAGSVFDPLPDEILEDFYGADGLETVKGLEREEAARQGSSGREVRHLPWHHRDPLDRMLVAQARLERCHLITNDRAISAYAVDVLW
jgi:prevent-host-death family protein